MITFDIAATVLAHIDNNIEVFMTSTLTNVMGSVKPFAISVMASYLGYLGYLIWFGLLNEPIQTLFWRLIKLSIVFAFVTNPSLYNQFIGDWLSKLPEALAGLVLDGQTNNTSSFLDGLLAQFYDARNIMSVMAYKNSNTFGIPNIDFIIAGWLVLGAGIVLILHALFILIMAKMAIAILLSVGPIFIFMVNFQSTRKFFDAWIGQILTFSFSIMLLTAVLKLVLVLLQEYLLKATVLMAKTGVDPTIDQIVPVLILQGIAFCVLWQVPSVASALGGGVGLSTLGVAGATFNKISQTAERAKLDKPRPSNSDQRTTNSIQNTTPTRKAVGYKNNKD